MTRFLSLAVIMMPHAAVRALLPADDPYRSVACDLAGSEFIQMVATSTKKVNPSHTYDELTQHFVSSHADLKCHHDGTTEPEFNGATYYGATALTIASANGRADVVNFILRDDDDLKINRRDKRGWTALMAASKNNHAEIVTILLAQEDIKVNLQDNLGQTALLRATLFGHTDVVRALLTHPDIDVNLKDKSGNTPLHYAREYNNQVLTQMLEQHGAQV